MRTPIQQIIDTFRSDISLIEFENWVNENLLRLKNEEKSHILNAFTSGEVNAGNKDLNFRYNQKTEVLTREDYFKSKFST